MRLLLVADREGMQVSDGWSMTALEFEWGALCDSSALTVESAGTIIQDVLTSGSEAGWDRERRRLRLFSLDGGESA